MVLKEIKYNTSMQNLVPIYITDKNIKIVNARELHEVLEIKKKFADWIKQNLRDYIMSENEPQNDNQFDYYSYEIEGKGNKKRKEYILTLDCAKELAMMSRCEKGKEIRRYFIEIEKSFNEIANVITNNSDSDEALKLAKEMIEKQKAELSKAIKNKNYNKKVNIELREENKKLKQELKSLSSSINDKELEDIKIQLEEAFNQIDYWQGVSSNLEARLSNKEGQLKSLLTIRQDGKKYFNLLANAHKKSIIAKDEKTKSIKAYTFRKNAIESNKDVKYQNKFTTNFIDKIHPLSIPLALKAYINKLSALLEQDFYNVIGAELINEVYNFISISEGNIETIK